MPRKIINLTTAVIISYISNITMTHVGPLKILADTPAVLSRQVGQDHNLNRTLDSCQNTDTRSSKQLNSHYNSIHMQDSLKYNKETEVCKPKTELNAVPYEARTQQ